MGKYYKWFSYLPLFILLFFSTIQAANAVPLDSLPVVVHVIHTGSAIGSPGNPSDANILAMIGQLNNAFAKNGSSYGGEVVPLAFHLARRSPACAATTGIIRMNGSVIPKYAIGGITLDTMLYPGSAFEFPVKSLSRWPNTDYINIWVVNMIDGNAAGTAGYAYFPQYNSAMNDGIVIRWDVVNGTDKVIVHEMGHFLNLDHTFGTAWTACEPETDCSSHADHICDTENCMFTYDCTAGINPCTGNNYIIADAAHNYTVLNNYMGYTSCQWMFTTNQKDGILNAMDMFRPGLYNSSALSAGTGSVPVAACIPTAVNGLSVFFGIEKVAFGSMIVYSNASGPDGNFYIDRTCNQQVTIFAGTTVPVTITGSYENFEHIKVFLDYNGNGVFNLPGEQIMSGISGSLTSNVVIPTTGLVLCTPIRLRVVTDHPSAPDPTPCMLTGTPAEGVGQIEDFTVIIKPRIVTSLSSGQWGNTSIWSCGCVPSASDAVVINASHIITVPTSGSVTCAQITVKPGGQLRANMNSNVHVVGGCGF